MLKNAQFISYDTKKYPFANILEKEVFKTKPLKNLHIKWKKQKQKLGVKNSLTYGDNLKLRQLMQSLPLDSNFMKLYYAFVANIIAPPFGRHISYSNRPKMRVHLANTPSVSKWHTDVEITKRPEQINVWLPFTDTFGTNSLWIESDYGLADYQPISVKYGQAFLFDGGCLSHGTVSNKTNTSRVSLDFRFAILKEDFWPKGESIIGRTISG